MENIIKDSSEKAGGGDQLLEKEAKVISERKMETGVRMKVSLSHVETTSRVWVTLTEDIDLVEKIQSLLEATEEDTLVPSNNFSPGEIHVTRFTEDNQLYRCRILTKSDNVIQVRFIDFGNHEVKLAEELFLVPDVVKEFPEGAISVDVETGLEDTEENHDKIYGILNQENLFLTIKEDMFGEFHVEDRKVLPEDKSQNDSDIILDLKSLMDKAMEGRSFEVSLNNQEMKTNLFQPTSSISQETIDRWVEGCLVLIHNERSKSDLATKTIQKDMILDVGSDVEDCSSHQLHCETKLLEPQIKSMKVGDGQKYGINCVEKEEELISSSGDVGYTGDFNQEDCMRGEEGSQSGTVEVETERKCTDDDSLQAATNCVIIEKDESELKLELCDVTTNSPVVDTEALQLSSLPSLVNDAANTRTLDDLLNSWSKSSMKLLAQQLDEEDPLLQLLTSEAGMYTVSRLIEHTESRTLSVLVSLVLDLDVSTMSPAWDLLLLTLVQHHGHSGHLDLLLHHLQQEPVLSRMMYSENGPRVVNAMLHLDVLGAIELWVGLWLERNMEMVITRRPVISVAFTVLNIIFSHCEEEENCHTILLTR